MSETDEPAATKKVKREKSAYEKLSLNHRKYVDERMAGFNGAEAVRRSGFVCKEPKIAAWRLNQLPNIKAAIAEREAEAMDNAGISLTRSWTEVARIAYFDPAKLVGDNGEHLPLHQIDEGTRAAIAGVEVEELYDGTGRKSVRIGDVKKYRIASKLEANKLILQAKGDLVERHEDLTPRAPPVIQIVRYSDSTAEGDVQPDPPRAD